MNRIVSFFKKFLFGISDTKTKNYPQEKQIDSVVYDVRLRGTRFVDRSTPHNRLFPPGDKKMLKQRDPFLVQIGLDFGTAFCKCVWRDIYVDGSVQVFCPNDAMDRQYPFLIPSSVIFSDGRFTFPIIAQSNSQSGALGYLKMALQKVALKKFEDPLLQEYAKSATGWNIDDFVQLAATFMLANIIRDVKAEVRSHFEGIVEGDYIAINMAVPVADKNQPDVEELFDRTLRTAFVLSDDESLSRSMTASEFSILCQKWSREANSPEIREACYLYPEVSANVQGFVKSRTSPRGIFLFSDTGAGTVDQSVFILHGQIDSADPEVLQKELVYISAEVHPLGSGQLEKIAAELEGKQGLAEIESWRSRKELNENHPHLEKARERVAVELAIKTKRTIGLAVKRLHCKPQINELNFIFGGGGHCAYPYQKAVVGVLSSPLFSTKTGTRDDFEMGMPVPIDLPVDPNWMQRLSVAYGLSFPKDDLAPFYLPSEVELPKNLEPSRKEREMISKDQV